MATRGVEPASKTCLVGVQARIPSLPAPSQTPVTHCSGVSPVCVRRCTSRWFFLLKDLPQVSQVNSRTPGENARLRAPPLERGLSGVSAALQRPDRVQMDQTPHLSGLNTDSNKEGLTRREAHSPS